MFYITSSMLQHPGASRLKKKLEGSGPLSSTLTKILSQIDCQTSAYDRKQYDSVDRDPISVGQSKEAFFSSAGGSPTLTSHPTRARREHGTGARAPRGKSPIRFSLRKSSAPSPLRIFFILEAESYRYLAICAPKKECAMGPRHKKWRMMQALPTRTYF